MLLDYITQTRSVEQYATGVLVTVTLFAYGDAFPPHVSMVLRGVRPQDIVLEFRFGFAPLSQHYAIGIWHTASGLTGPPGKCDGLRYLDVASSGVEL